jgi:dTMP kinase
MKFLVFEGLDGSGKSSLMKVLSDVLLQKGQKVHSTREPGGSPLGDALRDLILSPAGPAPKARAELLMYEASRAQHVDEVILPKLKQGYFVLSDRFSASSIAFQAGGREISLSDVEWLNHFATQGLQPDYTILLDLSVEESRRRRMSRAQKTGETEDRIEAEAEAFHERVRQGFLMQALQDPSKWLVLDAQKSPTELATILLKDLEAKGLIPV